MRGIVGRGIIVAVLLAMPFAAWGQETIVYSGSSTIGMGVLQEGGVKAFEEKTKMKIGSVENIGSGKGIQALLDDKATIAGASRPLKAEEKAKKLLGHTIGYDAIAVFVHKSNPVKNLTKEQIKGIFTGQIKNWKEVGGKNAPITPNTEIQGGKRATIEFFQEHVMDGAAFGKGFKEIDLPRDQIVELAREENGICGVSYGLLAAAGPDVREKVKAVSVNGIDPTVKNIQSGAYLISRPLLLVTKGLPKAQVKSFIDFMLSKDGQQIVSRNFVPVSK